MRIRIKSRNLEINTNTDSNKVYLHDSKSNMKHFSYLFKR